MKKLLILITLFTLVLSGCTEENPTANNQEDKTTKIEDTSNSEENKTASDTNIQADKIKIVLFHGTQTCSSCDAMKASIQKTLDENFKEEVESGKIVYKKINGELQENREITMKYRATGLSVFINTINDGEDNIQEERALWRYIQNEEQFKKYLTDKLNNL